MALQTGGVLELRDTGAATNGCYYDSTIASAGTDYSQQDAAQASGTDGTCANNTTFVSVLGAFTAAMIGNGIYISGTNFTTGLYVVTARASATSITLDRNPTTGVAASIGVYAVGGASTTPAVWAASLVPGNTVWVKKGTYSWATFTKPASTGAAPISILGYNASRADNPTLTNRPTITMTGEYVPGDTGVDKNLIMTGSLAAGSILHGGVRIHVENCKITNSSATATAAFNPGASSTLLRCEGISATAGFAFVGAFSHLMYCNAHDSINGAQIQIANCTVVGCVFDTCTTGISSISSAPHITLSTIYNCTTGVDFSNAAATRPAVTNCIIANCSTGINGNSSNNGTHINEFNTFSSNTADVSNFTKQTGCITGSASMTDPTNADFTIPTSSNCVDTAMQVGVETGVVGNYGTNIGVSQTLAAVTGQVMFVN